MLNSPSPLPEKNEPLPKNTLPLTLTLPVNSEPLISDFTINPLSTSVDAVTEPVAIIVATKASGVKADFGMLNNFSPLPLK